MLNGAQLGARFLRARRAPGRADNFWENKDSDPKRRNCPTIPPVSVVAPAKPVKTKNKCCKSSTRCKKCPAAWKALENEGYAERIDVRVWRPTGEIPKKVMKRARKRPSGKR
jgi:hypothetical protein